MKCTKCQAPMLLASSSRGFQTYRCARGCADSYQFTYNDESPKENKNVRTNVPDLQIALV